MCASISMRNRFRAELLGGGGTPICVAPRNLFRIEMEAHMRKSYLAVLVLTAALAGALLVPPATSAQNTGWPFYGCDPGHTHLSALSQISTSNCDKLKADLVLQLGTLRTPAST